MIEVFLIGLVVALVGAGGYVFFYSSMQADRRNAADYNLWDQMIPREESDKPKRIRLSKGFIIWLIAFIIAVSALVIFLMLISARKSPTTWGLPGEATNRPSKARFQLTADSAPTKPHAMRLPEI